MDYKKPVVLAIDDQPVILHTVASELKELYQVKAFTSGSAALRYLSGDTADLILLDYDMPDMNGLEVFRRLKDNSGTSVVPVIFLTGSENGSTEVKVLAEGAADYIQKPIKPQVLLTRVRMHLELYRYRNHLETLVSEQTEHLRQANERLRLREDMTLNLLAETTDMRDHDTGDHINRVTEMVRVIVGDLQKNPKEGYELTQDEAEDIIRSVKLHDLGKIAVPDGILLKPGRLEPSEFEIIKQHPAHGAKLFNKYITRMGSDSFLDTARDISLGHHEKWDGTGYPGGLAESAIPLSARITAIADVYDALTSERPYKKPLPHSKAVEIIAGDSGTHFDPVLVGVFLKHEDSFRRICEQFRHTSPM